MAVIVKNRLKELNIRIPQDVQIIGYDGMRMLNYGNYVVSSIAQPVEKMASACVDVLIKEIKKEPYEKKIILPVMFVEGGTTR